MIFRGRVRIGNTWFDRETVTAHEYRRRDGGAYRLALTFKDGSEVEATGPRTIGLVAEIFEIQGPPPLPGWADMLDAGEGLDVTRKGNGRFWRLTGDGAWRFRGAVDGAFHNGQSVRKAGE